MHLLFCLLLHYFKVFLDRPNNLSVSFPGNCSKGILYFLDFKQKYVLVFLVFHLVKIFKHIFFEVVFYKSFEYFDFVVFEFLL